MITVMASNNKDAIEIILDDAGIEKFIYYLTMLKERQDTHSHLMTKDWGGNELGNESQGTFSDGSIIHMVNIVNVDAFSGEPQVG
ncbi:MAG: Imm32 family immunity protein [Alphaproteobacteria bacterium]|nr:Imm32 family immunity protein [Alphaproteobacteria bacterium]